MTYDEAKKMVLALKPFICGHCDRRHVVPPAENFEDVPKYEFRLRCPCGRVNVVYPDPARDVWRVHYTYLSVLSPRFPDSLDLMFMAARQAVLERVLKRRGDV